MFCEVKTYKLFRPLTLKLNNLEFDQWLRFQTNEVLATDTKLKKKGRIPTKVNVTLLLLKVLKKNWNLQSCVLCGKNIATPVRKMKK